MVHGAIFNRRTQILIDSGASTSIMSLDLARRLKLKLRYGYKLRVTGVGDVPTYVTTQARVRLTLGVRVVYWMDIWVGNIGRGVDCFLGMDFMVAAGVRLCAHEGIARLPDEESLILAGGPDVNHVGLDIDIELNEGVDLGRSVIVLVRRRRADPEKVQVWAGRGDQWVTQLLYGPGGKPKAVKVVNVSDRIAQLHHRTVVACLVEENHIPIAERFVRPKSRKYHDWGQLIFEAEPSMEFLELEKLAARQAELTAPPTALRSTYSWPKKLLLRRERSVQNLIQTRIDEPSDPTTRDYLVSTQPNPGFQIIPSYSEQGRVRVNGPGPPPVDESILENDSGIPELMNVSSDSQSASARSTRAPAEANSESDVDSTELSGGSETLQHTAHELGRIVTTQAVSMATNPMLRLQESLAQCLRVGVDDTDAETTVDVHRVSDCLSDLRGQLVARP
jgi:hypothetical protein